MNYLFTFCHRLNRGAMTLNNQEIRNCIYSGTFNDHLEHMDQNEIWLRITGRSSSGGDRYRGQEQILRFLAFRNTFEAYRGRLATFLNDYMSEHRAPDEEFLNDQTDVFTRTNQVVYNSIFEGRMDERPGISVLEATMVGVAQNLDKLETHSNTQIRQMYDELLRSDEFADERLREGLSGRPRVLGRLSTAVRVFSGQ